MVFKINIGEKGKSWKLELDSEALMGKKIGEKLPGNEINADLSGYEFEITGTSDIAGFPGKKDEEGHTLRKVLLTAKSWGCWQEPKGLRKKKPKTKKGLRLRKTVRGNAVSADTVQINTKVVKEGTKKFEDFIPKKEAPAAAA